MKMYRIRNKMTGQYVKRLNSLSDPVFSKEGVYLQSSSVNYIIKDAVYRKAHPFLASIDIITYNLTEVGNGTSVEELRNRYEQDLVIQTLKDTTR